VFFLAESGIFGILLARGGMKILFFRLNIFCMLLSASEIMSKSLELFKRDFKTWLPYMILSFVAALLSTLVAFNPTVLLFFNTVGISPNMVLLLSIIAMLLLTVFHVWLDLVLVRVIHDRLFNRAVAGLRERFHESRHLLARSIGISLLVTILVSLPLILSISGLAFVGFENLVLGQLRNATLLYLFFGLLLVYGLVHLIYFSIRYALSYYVVAIDEKNIGESLHQGHKLTHGRMGSIFWRLFAPVVVFLLMYVLANYVFGVIATAIGGNIIFSIARWLSLAVSVVVAVLIAISTVILYEDAKAKPLAVVAKKD